MKVLCYSIIHVHIQTSNNSANRRLTIPPPANLPYPTHIQPPYHTQQISMPTISTIPYSVKLGELQHGQLQVTYIDGNNETSNISSNTPQTMISSDFRTALSELTTSSSASCCMDDDEDNFDSVSTRMNKRRKHRKHHHKKHKHHKRDRNKNKKFVEPNAEKVALSEATHENNSSAH